jgi:hypothetical protein
MKLIKSTIAMAAAFALWVGVAQAVTPVSFNLTGYVQPGATMQTVLINNAVLLNHMGKALNVSMAGLKLCVNTNGSLVIADGAGTIVYDLSAGVDVTYNISTSVGPNNTLITNYTKGQVYVQNGNQFYFYDLVGTGSATTNSTGGADTFDIKGPVVGDYFKIRINRTSYTRNITLDNTTVTSGTSESLEISDGSVGKVACKLADGVYTQSFTLWASGFYSNSQLGYNGILFGTVSASGTQTGGMTFLDPFNGFGNYDTDFTF